MSADLEQRIRIGLREYADAPSISAPPVESVMVRAAPRRGPARRTVLAPVLAPLLAAAAVLSVFVLTAVAEPHGGAPGMNTGSAHSPLIPSTFAPFSFLTGDLAAAPIDQAV